MGRGGERKDQQQLGVADLNPFMCHIPQEGLTYLQASLEASATKEQKGINKENNNPNDKRTYGRGSLSSLLVLQNSVTWHFIVFQSLVSNCIGAGSQYIQYKQGLVLRNIRPTARPGKEFGGPWYIIFQIFSTLPSPHVWQVSPQQPTATWQKPLFI